MLEKKIGKWLQNNFFPQRLLLSGESENLIDSALEIVAKLQNTSMEKIKKGVHLDTIFFPDKGKSFKIDFSEAAKKDEQGEFENIRGMIRWISQKPVAKYRIIILENFERATLTSPHAILKILEEPPKNGIFIFTTKNHYQIIDTILSRMVVFRIFGEKKHISVEQKYFDFLENDLIAKFKFIENLNNEYKKNKDRIIFLSFLKNLIEVLRQTQKFKFLENIFDTYTAILNNQNPKLSMERLATKIDNF